MLPSSRRLPLLVLLAAGPLAAACGKSSGPRPTLDVAVALVGTPRDSSAPPDPDGIVKHVCDARLQATATGTGDATWTGAKLRYFSGADESKIFDSSTVDAAQMANTWGSGSIEAGRTYATTYRITAKIPFGALVDFKYKQSGGRAERTARVPVHCAG